MKNIFKGEHFYDLAKQAKFQPHPVVAVLLFLLVTSVATSVSGTPAGIVMYFFASRGAASPTELLTNLMTNNLSFTQTEAGIINAVNLWCTAIAAAIVIVYCRFAEGRSLKSMGLHREKLPQRYGIGLLAGMAAFSAVMGISAAVGAVNYRGMAMDNGFLYAIICVGWILQGAEEEIICRGFLMTTLSEKAPMWAAVLINSVVFSAMHLANPGVSIIALLNITLVGIFLSLLAVRCNSLIPSCAFHSVWNWAQGNFYGLAISGTSSGPSVMRFELAEGMELWTGGQFGLEGGLAVTIVCAVLIAGVLLLPKKADTVKQVS